MALLAARLGYEAVPLAADSKMMKVFERGHRVENEILEDKPGITYRQHKIDVPLTGKIHVVGHIDGFKFLDHAVVEVKSQSREAWDEFEAKHWNAGLFPKYKWQVSCYMHAFECPLLLIRALVDDDGRVVARDESFVDEPFYSIAEIRSRVLRVEAAAATGVLNAECINSFPCPYFYLHDEVDRELIDDESVEALAREYACAGADAKAARGRQEAAKRALRETVEGNKYSTESGVRITFYAASNPPQLDKELLVPFLEGHGRTLDQFMMQGKSERLKVTLPKEDDE